MSCPYDACRKGARCLRCIERDGATAPRPAPEDVLTVAELLSFRKAA